LLEPGYETLPAFMAEHGVEVVASLPCYEADNVDKQRGKGVFDGSIRALQRLNDVGYGQEGGPRLDLVYNPVGYDLPPDEEKLEAAYREKLRARFGIGFHDLFTIANMPIRRFAHALQRDGQYEAYMAKLQAAHHPENAARVMCRSLVSVGWQGAVYDCDFNQMLQMPLSPTTYGEGDPEHEVERESAKLWDFAPEDLVGHPIRTGAHCFGCTAGNGSSCTGALT
jgi:radical SAM/Cys-rich protein